jgi:threonine/homoserine/homoserine lactone efflux protein
MATLEARPLEAARVPASYVQWSAVIAGAVAAAAISFILVAFGVASTSPTWRDASFALWLLSGLYLVFVALVSFGFGGYVAGRLRTRFTLPEREQNFRDGCTAFCRGALQCCLAQSWP